MYSVTRKLPGLSAAGARLREGGDSGFSSRPAWTRAPSDLAPPLVSTVLHVRLSRAARRRGGDEA